MQTSRSLCEMPANEHFWQGVEVQWRGEIVEIAASPHGGTLFTDPKCGRTVKVNPEAVRPMLYGKGAPGRYTAVATYDVRGRISYDGGEVRLKLLSATRRSPWITDGAKFREHLNNFPVPPR